MSRWDCNHFFCAGLLMLLLGIGLDNNSGTKEFGLERDIYFVFCSLGIKTKKKVCKIKFTVLYLRPFHLQFFTFLTVVLSPSYLATLFFSSPLHFWPLRAAREGKKKKENYATNFSLPLATLPCLSPAYRDLALGCILIVRPLYRRRRRATARQQVKKVRKTWAPAPSRHV